MDLPLESLELRIIEKALKKKGLMNDQYLEVGCGDGFNLERFSKLGMQGTGIDLSREAVDIVRAKNLPRVKVMLGDFLEASSLLQSANSSPAPLIFMLNILEHVHNDKKFMARAYSLLPPGGRLIIAVPANEKAFGFADENAGHLRRYQKIDLWDKLVESGFEIEEWFSVGFPVNRSYTWLFNFLNRNRMKKPELEQTLASGIRNKEGYYGGVFDLLAKIAFPILVIIVRIDGLFVRTDLGNNFVVFAKKKVP